MNEEQFTKAIASGPVTTGDLLRLYGEVDGLTRIVRRLEAAGTVEIESFRSDKGWRLRFKPKATGKPEEKGIHNRTASPNEKTE